MALYPVLPCFIATSLLLAGVAAAEPPTPLQAAPTETIAPTDEVAKQLLGAVESVKNADLRRILKSFYRAHEFHPVWNEESAARATAGLGALSADGLNVKAYFADVTGIGTPEGDVRFSEHLLRLLRDVRIGVSYKQFDEVQTLYPPKDIDYVGLLNAALTAEGAAALGETAPPQLPEYKALKHVLADLRARREAGGFTAVPTTGKNQQTALTARLRETGDLSGEGEPDADARADALRRFQFRFGLRVTGKLDVPTRTALGIPVEELIAQVQINLERMRRLPESYNERLLAVNIPEALLEIYEGGRLNTSMRVIVGKPKRPSPSLSSQIQSVEFHPYWHVPTKLALEDLLPLYRKDPTVFAARGIRVYSGNVEIDPADVDWSAYDRNHFPYRLRQDPGEDNSLGDIKFAFANPFAVYLHDTPHRNLFSHFNRAQSSGCIRVADPHALAEFVLSGTRDADDVAALFENAKHSYVEPKLPVSVRLTYLTARVDGGGTVRFLPDIYKRDADLRAFLARTGSVSEL